MYFNSVPFLVFLPTVFVIYWFILKNNLRFQNILLLISSYIFYGWWDYRFLLLIAASTLIDYYVGIGIDKSRKTGTKKGLLILSLIFNLGVLAYFKYFNFFIQTWISSWEHIGINMDVNTMKIILPVGISFYTFQTLSYTIDVYRYNLKPTRNFIQFATYVSFFPQLVAGPIERASRLLPQFKSKRVFNFENSREGLHLILWGLFQKVVIADSCAIYVNNIFQNSGELNGLSLFLGAFYFAFQIYGDFAGYSNMAIGTARLFGFDLMRNFNYPYFSRNIAEFWRRWHISLSTWFRDYLYIPLGGSRGNIGRKVRNVFIVFLVSGFWHGANWTFIVWGAIHALLFLPLLLSGKNKRFKEKSDLPGFSLKDLSQMCITFLTVTIAWVFFRADNLSAALFYLKRLATNRNFAIEYLSIERYNVEMLLIIAIFILIEWFHRNQEHPFMGVFKWPKIILIILMLLTLGVYADYQEFIYFQF